MFLIGGAEGRAPHAVAWARMTHRRGSMPAELAAKPRRQYAPRMPPEQRREQLLDAALGVIVEQGYSGVSIEAIARTAGVTRPVVYDHFPNLGRLLQALIEREEHYALRAARARRARAIPATPIPLSCSPPASRRFLDGGRGAGPPRGGSSCCRSRAPRRSSASTSRPTARGRSSGSSTLVQLGGGAGRVPGGPRRRSSRRGRSATSARRPGGWS